MCRQRITVTIFASKRSVGDEVRKLTRGKPGKLATIINPTKRKPPISLDPMPAQHGGVDLLAAHGLHRIAKNRFNVSNLDRHFPV
jgi:hypothetical protein